MKPEKKKLSLTQHQALLKAAAYCAYQERCHQEVEQKLAEWGVFGNDAGNVLHLLIEQNYLNEERFAKAFAGGKFRVKKWGRVKIRLELKARHISEYCIRSAMKEINADDYHAALLKLIEEKRDTLSDENPLARKSKLAAYLMGKGYEGDLVWDAINSIK